jgi:hypothetical protein
VTGLTESTNFRVVTNALATSVVQNASGGNADAFVAKIGSAGTNLEYSTYLGGYGKDYGLGIALDSLDQAVVAGYTASVNFQTTNALVISNSYAGVFSGTRLNKQTTRSTATDGFVCKLAADGSALVFSSYLGGTSSDVALHVAVDSQDFAYVTGYTYSKDFPTNGIPQPRASGTTYSSHVFVTRIGPNGAEDVPYSVAFGSSSTGQGTGVAVDTNLNAYVTGYYTGTDFFAASSGTYVFEDLRSSYAIAKESKSKNHGFVAVLDPSGTNFLYGMNLGGAQHDMPYAIAVQHADTNVNVVVVGMTSSRDFPTNNAVQRTLGRTRSGSGSDAFVEKIRLP